MCQVYIRAIAHKLKTWQHYLPLISQRVSRHLSGHSLLKESTQLTHIINFNKLLAASSGEWDVQLKKKKEIGLLLYLENITDYTHRSHIASRGLLQTGVVNEVSCAWNRAWKYKGTFTIQYQKMTEVNVDINQQLKQISLQRLRPVSFSANETLFSRLIIADVVSNYRTSLTARIYDPRG